MKMSVDQMFAKARQLPVAMEFSSVEQFVLQLNPVNPWFALARKFKSWLVSAVVISVVAFVSLFSSHEKLPKTYQERETWIEMDKLDAPKIDNKSALAADTIIEPDSKPESVQPEKPSPEEVEEIPSIKEPVPVEKPVEPIRVDSTISHGALAANAAKLEAEKAEQLKESVPESSCNCQCGNDNVYDANHIEIGGIMSFYFQCTSMENTVGLDKDQLKDFEHQLWRMLKKSSKLITEADIDYTGREAISVNRKIPAKEELDNLQKLFDDFGITPTSNRKILIDKRQIWVGDFVDGKFFGTAKGFNIKKSLAEKYLE